ncbi:MAG: MATE family efflux transporter, partial [Clostridia bacterium]
MKEKLKKFIGSKEFYKRFFMIVIPIMAQQLLVSLAGYVDNLMINSYGGIEFAAAYNGVSAANRVMFIFNFVWLGTATTASIFIAQYFGAKNQDKINEAFRLSIYVAVIFGVVSFAIIAFFGNFFVDAFVQDSAARAYGYDYIQVIKWGTVITALILCLETAFRTIKQPIIALIAAVSGIVVNIFFNYCYIFGNFGFPELAAEGAAIATVISRVVELGILILALIVKRKKFFTGFAKKITVGKDAIRAYVKKGIPLIMNELMWSFGIILMTLFCTWRNDLWYTAYSYSQNISDLFFIIFAGLG